MTNTPVYLLTIAGNSSIEISQDELRSLLGQIETKLHRSKVYRNALATLQNLLGPSSEQAKVLFKAISREAIALSFQQFATQESKVTDNQQINTADVSPSTEIENGDLSQCLSTVKLNTNNPQTNEENLRSQSVPFAERLIRGASPTGEEKVLHNQVADNSVKAKEDKAIPSGAARFSQRDSAKKPTHSLKRTRKPSKAELAKQLAAEQRIETLRQIGQQLQKARFAQGLSLVQLNAYTHVPIHHMEAIENGNLELLPEDVYLRGFIRVMGNALGLNGTTLIAALPVPEIPKAILPISSRLKNGSPGLGLDVRPVHLYVGYTALVAGAVGGLSFMSQQANTDRALIPDEVTPSAASQSSQRREPTTTPGLRSSSSGVSVGSDIAPPEAL
ncbi:helix-turn-helix domain-containing protein [Scytonema hofmannii FACHB-248]|uniref:Helix-turn-helix domain-containing protein n=1 Tax=Scytonema hofmannii FACHB-248 TaxID=1842502 RepID=A0ABR8GW49_9CYAN|nr:MULTISPECIES: helix-turn-helix domain-containing protein [Nostocales]MBD2607295.1 helix-turn-helix domain-containing protein [Scytonema hofmannii FACHB-248]